MTIRKLLQRVEEAAREGELDLDRLATQRDVVAMFNRLVSVMSAANIDIREGEEFPT